jgi:hypothetical protein
MLGKEVAVLERVAVLKLARWVVVALLVLAPVPGSASRLAVRARTLLQVTAAEEGESVVVRGRLVDARMGSAAVDSGIAGAELALTLVQHHTGNGPTRIAVNANTGDDGRFQAPVERHRLHPGERTLHVEARYAGGARLGSAAAELLVDLDKPEVTLELSGVPKRLAGDAPGMTVDVAAHSGDLPRIGMAVQLTLDGKPLLALRTGPDGHAQGTLPLPQLGAPGPHVLRALAEPAPGWNAGMAEVRFERVQAVAVELTVQPGSPAQKCGARDGCLEGRVIAFDGPREGNGTVRGIPDAAVTLHADQRQLGALVTDADGHFAAVLHGDVLLRAFRPGPLGIVARAAVPRPYHEIGWSGIAVFDLAPPPEVLPWVYAVALVLIVGGLVARQAWRRRAERALIERLESGAAGLPLESVRRTGPGGEPGCRLRGRVVHGETGRGAPTRLTVQPLAGGPPAVEQVCKDGTFRIDSLAPGAYDLEALAADHEPLRLRLDLPHDGTWDGCELLPASCRAVVRGAYSQAVRRTSGRPVEWGKETAREASVRWTAGQRRRQEAVAAVELALYAGGDASERAAEAKSALTKAELPRDGVAP